MGGSNPRSEVRGGRSAIQPASLDSAFPSPENLARRSFPDPPSFARRVDSNVASTSKSPSRKRSLRWEGRASAARFGEGRPRFNPRRSTQQFPPRKTALDARFPTLPRFAGRVDSNVASTSTSPSRKRSLRWEGRTSAAKFGEGGPRFNPRRSTQHSPPRKTR
ncbi:hypothetical protein Poly24_15250 [Rosistilla carotiformis]|uniref:Uncharacterized protein n=1 Tax=Rosistilla carotiformis TaxID=2528017 RepID=A0A518JQK8_9BACT|nr:hypothetical protein Poly24_15250 [Rosistilla carotiformis]